MGENSPLRYEAGSGDPVLLLHGFNLEALLNFPGLTDSQQTAIGTRALRLFPSAAARLADSTHPHDAAT
jgi:hypothetical protein